MLELSDTLLKAILATVGRKTFSESELREIVMPRGTGASQLAAYNMCDGSRTQSEIGKAQELDPGSFSRTVARWTEAGVVFRIPEGRDVKLLHVYPLLSENSKKEKSK